MIPFNKPPFTGDEEQYILEAIGSTKISGNGAFSKKCEQWFESTLQCEKALLTPSGTHALEMAAMLIDIEEGDEVIMPSYTFVSTANAFVLRGAKIVFVDIRPDTMNIDESLIECAITAKTKAIVPVHYAGVGCEMDTIMEIANRYNIYVIEDAAQGVGSSYKEKPLGAIGHLGAFSFHETKNFTSAGEGGLLIINNKVFTDKAEIIHEKGTNRNQFLRGAVDKYSWVNIGSSYLMNDVSAAYLWGQLAKVDLITKDRLNSWQEYYNALSILVKMGFIEVPVLSSRYIHNGHMFYIKVKDLDQRTRLLEYLNKNNVNAVFHYVPLHSSVAGKRYGVFHGNDVYTTKESERLIRLPMYYGLTSEDIKFVTQTVQNYFIAEEKLDG